MYDDVAVERDYTLQPLAESNRAIRLSSPTNPDEYFILENRQQEGWDAYLPARGLMITHIDYDEQLWDNNAVNTDPNHQHIMMMAADNNWNRSTQTGDLYPGLLGNTSFTDRTKPNSLLWDGTPLCKPVTGIRLDGSDITFHVALEASGISHTFNSQTVDNGKLWGIEGTISSSASHGIVIQNGVKKISNK